MFDMYKIQKQEIRNISENHRGVKNWRWKYKVEKILKGSLDSIPSSSPAVKIQIISGKVYLR